MDWIKIIQMIKNQEFTIKYMLFMNIIRSISNKDLEYLLVEMEYEKEERERE